MPAHEQALEDVARDRGADGFSEAQVEVEEGLEAETMEDISLEDLDEIDEGRSGKGLSRRRKRIREEEEEESIY